MKWFLMVFQLFTTFKNIAQTKALMEKAKDVAEQSKRMAFFSFTLLIAFIYWIAGSIVAAIAFGHQIDNGDSFHWSGMLWASLGLIVFGLFVLTVGLIVLKFPTDSEAQKTPEHRPASKELSEALEKLALTFVNQMIKNLVEPKQQQRTQSEENSEQK